MRAAFSGFGRIFPPLTRLPRNSPLVSEVWQVGGKEGVGGKVVVDRGHASADSVGVCFDYMEHFRELVARLVG